MRFTCCRCWSASTGAVAEAMALLDWRLAPVWQRAGAELAKAHTRKPDQEWVRMLRLMETHPAPAVERSVTTALARHSPRGPAWTGRPGRPRRSRDAADRPDSGMARRTGTGWSRRRRRRRAGGLGW